MSFQQCFLTFPPSRATVCSPMFTVDAQARIISANNKAIATFGYPKETIIGAFLDIILDNVNEIRATMAVDESAVIGMDALLTSRIFCSRPRFGMSLPTPGSHTNYCCYCHVQRSLQNARAAMHWFASCGWLKSTLRGTIWLSSS